MLTFIKLMKGKALRKHSLHEKTAASVLLKLFITVYNCDHTIIDNDEFFNIDHTKLNDNKHEIFSGQISETECKEEIQNMKNNKSPGSDGISVEFYELFWEDIKILFKFNKLLLCNRIFN